MIRCADAKVDVRISRVDDPVVSQHHWYKLRHTCSACNATTDQLLLNASTSSVASALMTLPGIGVVVVRADRTARDLGAFGWLVEFSPYGRPAHVGPEPLLEVIASDGVSASVERARRGRATRDELVVRVADDAKGTVEEKLPLYVRPVHDSPVVVLATSVAAHTLEDTPVLDLFRGISLNVDNDGRPDSEVTATLRVSCRRNCTITIPAIDPNSLGPWRRDDERQSALVLTGDVDALEALLKGSRWDPEPDFYGVDLATVRLVDADGVEAEPQSRSIRVDNVNDPPRVERAFLPSTISVAAAPAVDSRRPSHFRDFSTRRCRTRR